ncbi:uncharacterized protein [Nicotiana sylvestris]|uniref:uncharacterized protein n=1 Tax=Nicotiana sylvestris TaxID=4096 RepID=UPI00388C381B
MIFLLSALNIYYVLDSALPPMPEPTAEDSDVVKEERKKREHDELLCRGHILNTLTDRLYDLYCNLKSPREIWTALQTAYQNEKRGIDKFLALQYFEFKIFDIRPIMDQIHELQILLSKLSDLEVKFPDALQIGAILWNLPSSWNDYRKKILYSMDKMTAKPKSLERLKKSGNSEKANVVENSTQGLVVMVSAMQIDMVTELNVATAATNTQDWWLDSGATIHVCYDKKMFKTYAEVQDSEQVLMGNHVAADDEHMAVNVLKRILDFLSY